ncbi:hypothetical protein I79_001160 [Cricetulus griseus]|uniref:Uncharacterized protein n=1 Tax=Cricetulus griseus TaxID=10029 RepID=G3GU13_CRIGR|nr:hypothetical protein I79_001160 [Cricetulus griseus]
MQKSNNVMAIFIFGSNLTGCEFVCERTHGYLLQTGELTHMPYPMLASFQDEQEDAGVWFLTSLF